MSILTNALDQKGNVMQLACDDPIMSTTVRDGTSCRVHSFSKGMYWYSSDAMWVHY